MMSDKRIDELWRQAHENLRALTRLRVHKYDRVRQFALLVEQEVGNARPDLDDISLVKALDALSDITKRVEARGGFGFCGGARLRSEEVNRLNRSNAALRGVITRMKNKEAQ